MKMKSTLSLILPALAVLVPLAVPAHAALVLGGDFIPYKPGSTSITATYTGYVQWLSTIPNPTSPTSLTVNGGTATFSDSTTGATVDLRGWTNPQGGADLVNNGIGGSSALNMFAAWSPIRPIVETTGNLGNVPSIGTITITTMVGGAVAGPKSGLFFFDLYAGSTLVTPTTVVDQTLPLDGGFQMISRTYDSTALAAFIGQPTKIRFAIPDSNVIGDRIIFDNVTFVPEPSTALLGGLGLLALLRRRR
jgi:hypothetical protein